MRGAGRKGLTRLLSGTQKLFAEYLLNYLPVVGLIGRVRPQ
jgi:hypothetical protein